MGIGRFVGDIVVVFSFVVFLIRFFFWRLDLKCDFIKILSFWFCFCLIWFFSDYD